MCSQAKLLDKSTGHEATFPSTPVNHLAMSKEFCGKNRVASAFNGSFVVLSFPCYGNTKLCVIVKKNKQVRLRENKKRGRNKAENPLETRETGDKCVFST